MTSAGTEPGAPVVDPYPGLRAFEQTDGDIFFGREREIRDLRSLWLANRLTVMFGQSGVGKSSLLNAGVLRELRDQADRLPVGRVSPAPFSDLSGANPFTFGLLSSWHTGAGAEEMRGVTLREFFGERPTRLDEFDDPIPVLVAIDQFEELFLAPRHLWRHRDHFIDDLSAALSANPEVRLLVLIREDVLGALLPFERRLSPPPRRRLAVHALTREAALQAVTGPLRATGRSYAPGVAEQLVDNLRTTRSADESVGAAIVQEEFVEPVQLQIVCSALWAALPGDVHTITAAHLRDYGDVDDTMAAFYERTIAEVAEEHGVRAEDLRAWIEKNFITEMGTRGTVPEGAGQTAGMGNEVARALTRRHLLRAEHRLNARWYELQHDRLIGPVRNAARTAEPAQREQDAPMYLRAAQRALAAGELGESEEWARRAVQAAREAADRRNEAEGLYLLGQTAGMRGRSEEADDHFGEAVMMFETLQDGAAVAKVLTGLGDVRLATGRESDALASYERAVRREPSDLEALEGYARALWHLGRLPEARGAYARILMNDPGNVSALAARGELQAELREPQDAIRDLESAMALDLDPNRLPDLRSARALALAQLGRLDEAESELRAAIDANPRNARTYLRGGQTHLLGGRREEALELLRQSHRVSASGLFPYQLDEAADLERRLSG